MVQGARKRRLGGSGTAARAATNILRLNAPTSCRKKYTTATDTARWWGVGGVKGGRGGMTLGLEREPSKSKLLEQTSKKQEREEGNRQKGKKKIAQTRTERVQNGTPSALNVRTPGVDGVKTT